MSYAPNALGQPTQVGSYASGMTYHPDGSLAQATLGTNILMSRSLNTRQLSSQLRYALGGAVLFGLSLGFDRNANVGAITDLRPGGTETASYVHDQLDRLTQATANQSYGSASQQYDAYDNLRNGQLSSRSRNWDYGYDQRNRLSTVRELSNNTTVFALAYDGHGHVVRGGGLGFVYDHAGTLREITGRVEAGQPQPERYQTDAHGHRTRIETGNTVRHPFYRRAGQLLEESGPAGIERHIYLGTQLIALDTAGNSKVVLTDHLGSNVATATPSGTVLERSQFTPFGELFNKVVERGPGFTGHFEDVTGLNYMKARYQSGLLGRFLSPDPVGVDPTTGGNFNRYWYGNNNPVTMVDPDGRLGCKFEIHCNQRGPYQQRGPLGGNRPDVGLVGGLIAKALKLARKGGDLASVTAGAAEDLAVITSSTTSALDKVAAGGSLVSEVISPVSARDVKAVVGGAARGVDAAGDAGRRFIVDPKGNTLIEPLGGATVGNPAGTFVETRYPNGSPYQQLHSPRGEAPHRHGFLEGAGPNQRGPSLDVHGNVVPENSPAAHWPVKQ